MYVQYCNNKTTQVWFLREQQNTVTPVMVFGQENFQAKDHHECVSAPSEITRVWFYIYPMPQNKLPKNNF
jgi:hypothetical protein